METTATSILNRAEEKDLKEQFTMASILYQEGVQILLNIIKETKNPNEKKRLTTMASKYLDRAEKVKQIINDEKKLGTYREVIMIKNGATGYGYNSLFGRFLDSTITFIQIEDPYIRTIHQCQNLVRLCELAVQKCQSLSKISLVTTSDSNDSKNQSKRLEEIRQSLESHCISFEIIYSGTLHDRQIILDNGWIIKIGRGLDYFKAPAGKFALGSCDLELRPCHETTVDIFHKSQILSTINE